MEESTKKNGTFWSYWEDTDVSGIKTVVNKTLKVSWEEVCAFLVGKGLRALEEERGKMVLVRGHLVKMIDMPSVKNMLLEELKTENNAFAKKMVAESLMKSKFFTESNFVDWLPRINPVLWRDTGNTSYHYRRNGVVIVTKDAVEFLPYGHKRLDGLMVWEDQVIQRDYSPIQNVSDFEKVVKKITFDDERKLAMETAIGYLATNHVDPASPRLVIFIDEDLNAGIHNGRTGKSLVSKIIGSTIYGRTFCEIDMKNRQTSFLWQDVQRSTQFILLDDIREDYDMSEMFSILSSARMSVSHKREKPFYIATPKFALTANHALTGSGDSFSDRKLTHEIHPSFSPSYNPKMYLGKAPITEWNDADYNEADNYIFSCIQKFFVHGALRTKKVNVDAKELEVNTDSVFIEWADEKFSRSGKHYGYDLFQEFMTPERKAAMRPGNRSAGTQKFYSWLRTWAAARGWKIPVDRKGTGNMKVFELVAPENHAFNVMFQDSEIESLKSRIAIAVTAEDYEEALRLQKQIQALKQ